MLADRQPPAQRLRQPRLQALVGGVGPDQGDARERRLAAGEQQGGAAAVVDVGGVHASLEQAAFGVDQDVALAAGDLLAAIVATGATGLGGADGLAVDDGGRGLCLAADGQAVLLAQRRIDLLPGALPPPLGIVVEHGAPGWEVMRQGAPLASCAQQVEHGIDDAAQGNDLRMSSLLSGADQRRKDRPLRVAQVRRVRTRCHATEMVPALLLYDAVQRRLRAIKLLNSLSYYSCTSQFGCARRRADLPWIGATCASLKDIGSERVQETRSEITVA